MEHPWYEIFLRVASPCGREDTPGLADPSPPLGLFSLLSAEWSMVAHESASRRNEMKTLCLVRSSLFLLALTGVQQFAAAQDDLASTSGPKLYCGTDQSGFSGMDGQLAVVHTNGPSIVGTVQLFNLTVPLNGITFANTFLWAGQPEDVASVAGNTLRKISLN